MGTRGDDNEYQAYNGQRLTRYDPDYWTKKTFYGGLEEPARQAGLNNIVKIGNQYYVPQAAYDQSQAAMFPYSNKANESGFDKFMEGLFQSGPMIASAAFLGPAIAGAMGGAGVGAAASADAIGLAQMGQAAGLTGSALSEFVASGGTLGSTAAGAGGIASGFTASPYDIGPDFTGNVNDLTSSNQYANMTRQELVDLGQAVNPFTTNPSFADLGGTAGAAGGATGIAGLLQQLSTLTGLPTSAIERLGGAGISSLASMYGASKLGQASMDAANRVATANQSATQLQSQMYQDQVARQQPFYQAGVNALGPYTTGIMGTPEDRAAGRAGSLVRPFDVNKDYAQSPWYQASLDKRLKDYTNKMGSMGLVDSGPTRRGILDIAGRAGQEDITNAYNRYNQDLTTQRNALGNLAGFAPPAAAAMGAAGSNYGTNVNNLGINTATTYGNADMTGAAARQSAYMGAGGAFANALSPNPLNAYLNKQLGITS